MVRNINGIRFNPMQVGAGLTTSHLTKIVDPASIAKKGLTTSHLQTAINNPQPQPAQAPTQQAEGAGDKK